MTHRDAILPLVAAALLLAPIVSAVADERSASDHVLKAEVALHGSDYLTAVRQYRKAAELSDSVEIAQQATRLGFDYGFDEEALRAAAAIGDDRLQKQARGYVTPDSFTHGTSAERVQWFRTGFESGDVDACDTFSR